MKSDKVYIAHILDAIEAILKYTDRLDQSGFLDNSLIQDAVIRNLQVIGEATKKVSHKTRSRYTKVPWKQMAGMRDKLIHDYMGVDLWAVWLVVERDLPPLQIQLKEIIDKVD